MCPSVLFLGRMEASGDFAPEVAHKPLSGQQGGCPSPPYLKKEGQQ